MGFQPRKKSSSSSSRSERQMTEMLCIKIQVIANFCGGTTNNDNGCHWQEGFSCGEQVVIIWAILAHGNQVKMPQKVKNDKGNHSRFITFAAIQLFNKSNIDTIKRMKKNRHPFACRWLWLCWLNTFTLLNNNDITTNSRWITHMRPNFDSH